MFRGVLLVSVIVVALAASGTASAQNELVGTVGSASISLTMSSGGSVTRLAPGTFTITVRDQSADQNFHLTGPGVSIATEVEFVGTRTFTVTFREGRYTYVSDADAYLYGTFQVGTATTTTTTTTTTNKLVATVGPGFTINLTRGGRKVTRLKPGTYTIVVRDRARIHNFHLRGPGVNKKTGVAFVGTVRWRVKLVRGLYRYNCDPHITTLRSSFRVPA
jgi:hypothetical protein